MRRLGVITLSLVAAFAFSAVAASGALAANEGPKWKVNGKELKAGESREISFKSGVTKLEVPAAKVTITCNKDKQTGVATGNNIKGNGANPGTDEAVILFEECSTSSTCKAFTGTFTESIEVPVHTELAYETKVAAEKHEEPVGIIFRTTANTVSKFVTIKFKGTGCPPETTVNATGDINGAISGKAGVFCKIVAKATEEKLVHEIICPTPAVKKAWNWIGGALVEHKIGLEAFGFEALQVGKATVEVFENKLQVDYSVIL